MTGKVTTLPNGIRVLSINLPHMESVFVSAFVNVGARNETPEQNGISHFLEHMAFKGTTSKNCFQIVSDVERLGANVNAYTSMSRTAYYVSGRSSNLPEFVELIGDILLNSTLPEDEIDRERNVILQEYNRYQDDPSSVCQNLFDSAAFPQQSRGRKIIGEPSNINSFTRNDFKEYLAQYYTGSNIIVGVVGKFDETELVDLVNKHFGAFEKGTPTVTQPAVYGGGVAVQSSKFEQSQITLGFPIHCAHDKEYYADVVAAVVLGDGMSSPLFTEIREKRGLVYGIGSYISIQDDHGMLLVSAATTPENFDELFDVTIQVMQDHITTINQHDLERAKNQIAVSIMRKSERPFNYLNGFVEDLFIYGEQIPLADSIVKFEQVTMDEVKASMAKMMSKPPTLSMCGAGADDKYYDYTLARLAN